VTYVCPNGHDSTAADFCDTCGAKIDATQSGASGAPEASAAPPPTSPGGLACPNCGTENVPESLFCEACGYDFTTGAMPRGTEGAQTGEGGPGGASAAGAESPASGMPSAPPAGVALAPGGAAPGEGEGGRHTCPRRGDPPGIRSGQRHPAGHPTGVGRRGVDRPRLVCRAGSRRPDALARVAGRRAADGPQRAHRPGVGEQAHHPRHRLHHRLRSEPPTRAADDRRDTLVRRGPGSSNGTFVGDAGDALPEDPIEVGPKRELGDDDRIYVGAWTRIVVRPATPEEKAASAE
jgi:hypothetical protein